MILSSKSILITGVDDEKRLAGTAEESAESRIGTQRNTRYCGP
jgi:hypothetical protein